MIKALSIESVEHDVRSRGDSRKKVDRHVVLFHCPADKVNPEAHEWACSFEVPRGHGFTMRDFGSKADAREVQGCKI